MTESPATAKSTTQFATPAAAGPELTEDEIIAFRYELDPSFLDDCE